MDKEDIEICKLAMRFPWWVWIGLGALAYLGFNQVQVWSLSVGDESLRELIWVGSLLFKYCWPAGMIIFAVASVVLRYARSQHRKSGQA